MESHELTFKHVYRLHIINYKMPRKIFEKLEEKSILNIHLRDFRHLLKKFHKFPSTLFRILTG